LSALLFSPIIGFVLAFIIFRLLKLVVHDKRLYEPPEGDKPPVWWMRALLILTCTGVSFAHGTNDGQKSIGLIMLVIIGLFPTYFAVNLDSKSEDIAQIAKKMPAAADLIERYGDDQKAIGVAAARKLGETFAAVKSAADIPEAERPAVRNDLDQVLSELKTASEAKGISKEDKETAKSIHELTMTGAIRPLVGPRPQRALSRVRDDGRVQAHRDNARRAPRQTKTRASAGRVR
jgi:PiT family inorganic phosphate transporter